jgi:hypothetical protein
MDGSFVDFGKFSGAFAPRRNGTNVQLPGPRPGGILRHDLSEGAPMSRILRTALLVLAATASASAWAQATRAGKSDFSLAPVFSESKTYNFPSGSSVRTDTGTGLALSWAHNFNSQFQAGLEWEWLSADYRGTVAPGTGNAQNGFTFNSRYDSSTGRVTGTYHFSPKAFTFLVTGGLGVTWTDTNIPTGPTQPVCWWYPWYGEVCTGATPTKTSTDFSYNLGVGARYDVPGPNPYFFKIVFRRNWVDFGGYVGTFYADSFRLDFGFKF